MNIYPYAITDTGITCWNEAKGAEIDIFPQYIIITELIYNINTNTKRVKIEYKINNKTKYVIVDRIIIANKNKILELANNGIYVTSTNAKKLVDYLLHVEICNQNEIQCVCEVSKLGWYKDYGFVPYNDTIKLAETNGVNIDSYTQYGNFSEWLESTNIARRSHLYIRVMLATSFASPLLHILKALPFMTHLWGVTGNGKSVALMCAASVWGNPDLSNGIINNFNTTKVGLERLCEFVNNEPLFIDELETGGNRDPQDLVYMITQGRGKSRGTKSGGLDKASFWKCTSISTGENPLTSHRTKGGAVNRIIDLKSASDLLTGLNDIDSIASSWRNNYGIAGKIFTDYIHKLDFNYIYKMYKQYLIDLQILGATGKQNMSAALLLTADSLANDCIFQDNLQLTVNDLRNILLTNDLVSQSERLYAKIFDWIGINIRHFDNAQSDLIDQWGRIIRDADDNIISIKIIATQLESNFFKEINSATTLSEWKRLGYILTDKNRMTKQMHIRGIKTNVICIVPNDIAKIKMEKSLDDIPF